MVGLQEGALGMYKRDRVSLSLLLLLLFYGIESMIPSHRVLRRGS